MSSSKQPLYPEVIQTNPEADYYYNPTSSPSLYPSLDMKDLGENLIIHDDAVTMPYSPPPKTFEEVLIRVPGAIVHLIEKDQSMELACGELFVVGLWQGDNIVAVLVRVGDEIQWPLAKDEAAVKVDDSHYFFALRVPVGDGDDERGVKFETLNYGLSIASKGQAGLLKNFDGVLEKYSCFSVQKVKGLGNWGAIDGSVAKGVSPDEMMKSPEKKEMMEGNSAAYWTTLAPNVEDYSGRAAKLIAAGSGQLIRGILWCGDVTVDRLKWGNEFLKKRMGPRSDSEVSPETMKRIKRVKKMTKMSEKVAGGVLSGVIKVSGFFTGAIVNSAVGKKFFNLLPGEIVLASLDGFSKVFDAVEVAGRNVMSTSSDVTTELVSQRYGDQAGKATSEGLDAAGHAFGTAWAVFKIRKAFNPKSVIKPTTLAKAAAKAKADVAKSQKKSSKNSS